MKNAVIIHGRPAKEEYYNPKYPSSSNFHWIPWIQKQLIIRDILAQTPEMPQAYAPIYEDWKREFERFDVTPETILIGHSNGGGFLVRWLSENKDTHGGIVVLVAPWVDPGHKKSGDFFEFDYDPKLTERIKKFIIFNSDDDMEQIQKSVEIIRKEIPGHIYKEFRGYGHFIKGQMPSPEFPELLEAVV